MTKLCAIHHSHTDIGYTDAQSLIERRHVDFIRQALAIADDSAERRGPHFDGFVWTCEAFWAVERFLEAATPGDRERFTRAVAEGSIGISASYLNFNELIGYELLLESFRRGRDLGEKLGVAVDSAMTADINGYGWGYAEAMLECGVANLFSCVHTHHGMYPLGETQIPFWWETPSGGRVLVWSGEHYHFGNELGLAPGAAASYLTKDECDAEMIFHDHWAVAELRIPRYIAGLRERGYKFDIVPVMVSGLRTDNGPPSGRIVDMVERWNIEHGDVCRIQMTSLSGFFEELRAEVGERTSEIPTYRGDWPDWWSDGPGGNPTATRLMREAQRRLRRVDALGAAVDGMLRHGVVDDLLLYAEHTFSHSNAISDPWHPLVTSISARKQAYAATAHDAVVGLEDAALRRLGAPGLAVGVPLRFTVLNPFDYRVSGVARLPVGHYEFNELRLDRGARVLDASSGATMRAQFAHVPMGGEYLVWLDLAPGERRSFTIEPIEGDATRAGAAGEGAGDGPGKSSAPGGTLETEHVRIEWVPGDGVVRWIDRATGRNLLRANPVHGANPAHGANPVHGAFTPVYEVTPMHGRGEACSVRAAMGLNRKGDNVIRTAGCLIGEGARTAGPVVSGVTLDYGVAGSSVFLVELCAYEDEARVDVAVRIHKDSVWEPENVYLSLPFTAGPSEQLWLSKAGALEVGAAVRPRIDQIPGTLTDYYAVDDGFALVSDESGAEGGVGVVHDSRMGVAVSMPDCHLLQVGPLAFGERLLAGDPRLADDPQYLYAWLMNNFWETNFAASLGGFHEFRFSVRWCGRSDTQRTLSACRAANDGLIVFRHA